MNISTYRTGIIIFGTSTRTYRTGVRTVRRNTNHPYGTYGIRYRWASSILFPDKLLSTSTNHQLFCYNQYTRWHTKYEYYTRTRKVDYSYSTVLLYLGCFCSVIQKRNEGSCMTSLITGITVFGTALVFGIGLVVVAVNLLLEESRSDIQLYHTTLIKS